MCICWVGGEVGGSVGMVEVWMGVAERVDRAEGWSEAGRLAGSGAGTGAD